ncbi:hypothetical protein [Mycobacterium spongiae]|nr:hypothetical protein [Mycobacterium spongiae]
MGFVVDGAGVEAVVTLALDREPDRLRARPRTHDQLTAKIALAAP